jgi:hypothetical protein
VSMHASLARTTCMCSAAPHAPLRVLSPPTLPRAASGQDSDSPRCHSLSLPDSRVARPNPQARAACAGTANVELNSCSATMKLRGMRCMRCRGVRARMQGTAWRRWSPLAPRNSKTATTAECLRWRLPSAWEPSAARWRPLWPPPAPTRPPLRLLPLAPFSVTQRCAPRLLPL